MDEDAGRVYTNRQTWDDRVDAHVVAYGAEGFADDESAMSPVVMRDLEIIRPYLTSGPVSLDLVHLQCHIGTDTLTWARLGAHVTGVDFSGRAIAAARQLAVRAALSATFIESTVDDAPDRVGRSFDLVYTGVGAITWLPDLTSWARSIMRLLRPGGLFFIRDGHPLLYAIDFERDDDELTVTLPYFASAGAQRSDAGIGYMAAEGEETAATTYEWPHPMSEIIQALLDAGLELLAFHEHDDLPWRSLPQMVAVDGGFALPVGRERLPLAFSIVARRPL